MIFATPKGLEKANSPEVKVGMTDATFKCCPKKKHTGIYQILMSSTTTKHLEESGQKRTEKDYA